MMDEKIPASNSALKAPLQSKKFVAFLVAEVTWKVIIAAVVVLGMRDGDINMMIGAIILVCVLIAGFVEAGYIIGQGSLDKYLGLAQIAAEAGQGVVVPKGAELKKSELPPLPPVDRERRS